MKKTMVIEVKGRTKVWNFAIKADEKYLKEWQADGVPICLLANTIPVWAVKLGLTRIWFFVQNVWNFLRLW